MMSSSIQGGGYDYLLHKSTEKFKLHYIERKFSLLLLFNPSFSVQMAESIWSNVSSKLYHQLSRKQNQMEMIRMALYEDNDFVMQPNVQANFRLDVDHAASMAEFFVTKLYTNENMDDLLHCTGSSHDCDYIWDSVLKNIDFRDRKVANQVGKLLEHFLVHGLRGSCLLQYLVEHKSVVQELLNCLEHRSIESFFVRLLYSDHSPLGIERLSKIGIMQHLIDIFGQSDYVTPRSGSEMDKTENEARLILEIVHAPYMSTRGVAIYDEESIRSSSGDYESLNGMSGPSTKIQARKFSSRKINFLVRLMLEQEGYVHRLGRYALDQVAFWMKDTENNTLLKCNYGVPRAYGVQVLTQMVALVETTEFTEQTGRGQFRVECFSHKCPTHCVRRGSLYQSHKIGDGLRKKVFVELNCLLGIRIEEDMSNDSQQRRSRVSSSSHLEMENPANVHPEGAIVRFTEYIRIEDIHSVKLSDWCEYGFKIILVDGNMEYFAATSERKRDEWILKISDINFGNVSAVEMICSENWKEQSRAFKQLREAMNLTIVDISETLISLLASANVVHKVDILACIYGAVRMVSPTIDKAFAKCGLMGALMRLFTLHPNAGTMHLAITKIIQFVMNDPYENRPFDCPLVKSLFDKSAAYSMYSLLSFIREPATEYRCHVVVIFQTLLHKLQGKKSNLKFQLLDATQDPDWQEVLQSDSILGLRENLKPDSKVLTSELSAGPEFQQDLILKLSQLQPTTSDDSMNVSYFEGKGCVYGYMHKECTGSQWKQVVVVLEQISCKLWYFYPFETRLGERIRWKWVLPSNVEARFGQTMEACPSVGHYGLIVDAGSSRWKRKQVHFRLTSFSARDFWMKKVESSIETTKALQLSYAAPAPGDHRSRNSPHCEICASKFALYRLRYYCGRCRRCLCSKCCAHWKCIPEVGVHKPVRHCQGCFDATGGKLAETEPIQMTPIICGLKGSRSFEDLRSLSMKFC